MNSQCHLDPTLFTRARQQTEGWIDFRYSPEAVFARVSNHASMNDWAPLVHSIDVTQSHSVEPGQSAVGTTRHITFKTNAGASPKRS